MRRDYDFSQQLGRGSFGVVFKVRSKTDGCWYVCKQIQLQSMNKKAREEANQEVTLLRKVSSGSDYIVQYIESFLDGDSLHIIMEFCEHGDLSRYIKAQAGQNIHESTIWKFLVQIGLGLRWLHLNRILHRDIKTLNVFLTSANDVRLGDLGVARVLSHNTNFASTFVGTPYYLSPELCEEKPYNEKSDVWAYGIVVYEMCSLKHPFDARNHAALLVKILRGLYSPVPAMYSTELRELIDECMRRDYVQRPTFAQLMDSESVKVWSERLGISLDGSTVKPAVEKSKGPAAKTTAATPQRVARSTRAAPKRSKTEGVTGMPARRSEPVRSRGGAAKGRARGVEDQQTVKTQVICAPPSTLAAAQLAANRAPAGRGSGKPPVPANSPITRKGTDPLVEERRREAARREVANLPDRPDRQPSKERRNVTSVHEFMQMEADNASTIGSVSQHRPVERPRSADDTLLSSVVVRSPSPCNTTLTAGQVLQQAADLVADPLEITAVPVHHDQPTDEDVLEEDATILPRPPRPAALPVEAHLPPIPGVYSQPPPVPVQVSVSSVPEHLPPITPVRLHDDKSDAASAPQLRILRHLDENQHPLDCSIFGQSLGRDDDRWEDSLAYSVDNGTYSTFSHSLARTAQDEDHPSLDVLVKWDVTEAGMKIEGQASDCFHDELGEYMNDDDDDFVGNEENDEDEEDGLLSTAKLDSNGLLCDIQVLQWKVTDAEVNVSAQSGSRMDPPDLAPLPQPEMEEQTETKELPQPEVEEQPEKKDPSSQRVTEPRAPQGRTSEQQRAHLEKNVRKFSSQIDRQYTGIIGGLDDRARVVWDKLYSLFKAKMTTDLTDEDQSEIERFVFNSLPTESTDLIWKVYKVLHLEQERDRCQKMIAELS